VVVGPVSLLSFLYFLFCRLYVALELEWTQPLWKSLWS
jgi:hypothetical protein